MPSRILLWTDTPAAYIDAIAAADLSSLRCLRSIVRRVPVTLAVGNTVVRYAEPYGFAHARYLFIAVRFRRAVG